MIAQTHIIRRQTLELSIAAGQNAHQLQNNIKQIFSAKVTPLLDAMMSERISADELLRIDRLELDLGSLDSTHLDEQLTERVRDQFEQTLSDQIARAMSQDEWQTDASTPIQQPSEQPQRLNSAQAEMQLLMHYLRTGLLPWWCASQTSFDLGGIIQGQLKQQPRNLLQTMRQLPPGRTAARLSRQLDQPMLTRLIQSLAQTSSQLSVQDVAMAQLVEHTFAAIVQHLQKMPTNPPAQVYEDVLYQLLQPTQTNAPNTIQTWVEQKYVDAGLLFEQLNPLAGQNPLIDQVRHSLQARLSLPESSPSKQQPTQPNKSSPDVAQATPPNSSLQSDQQTDTAEQTQPDLATSGKAQPTKNQSDPLDQAVHPILDTQVSHGVDVAAQDTSLEHQKDDSRLQPQTESETDLGIESDAELGDELEQGIYLDNAGLVLAWPYLPRFWSALNLADAKSFINPDAQERAVLLLQYLVSGETAFQEHTLVLNKLLCGWPITEPVARELTLAKHENQEANELLDSVIANWRILKKTSRDGLRQTFIQREGRLSRDDLGWQLQVNRSGVDVLLDSLPWGIGLIRLPWMDQALRVEW